MANKIVRIILIIVVFIIFFEVGLISSYTIVTAEPPNVQGLIDMQIEKVTSIFSPEKVNEVLVKDPTQLTVSNKKEVALQLEELSKVDGVNIDSLNVTTFDDTDNENMTVNIEALGYASPNSTSGQIVISQDPSYKVIAQATASYKGTGLMVDTNTMVITSVLKLY